MCFSYKKKKKNMGMTKKEPNTVFHKLSYKEQTKKMQKIE